MKPTKLTDIRAQYQPDIEPSNVSEPWSLGFFLEPAGRCSLERFSWRQTVKFNKYLVYGIIFPFEDFTIM